MIESERRNSDTQGLIPTVEGIGEEPSVRLFFENILSSLITIYNLDIEEARRIFEPVHQDWQLAREKWLALRKPASAGSIDLEQMKQPAGTSLTLDDQYDLVKIKLDSEKSKLDTVKGLQEVINQFFKEADTDLPLDQETIAKLQRKSTEQLAPPPIEQLSSFQKLTGGVIETVTKSDVVSPSGVEGTKPEKESVQPPPTSNLYSWNKILNTPEGTIIEKDKDLKRRKNNHLKTLSTVIDIDDRFAKYRQESKGGSSGGHRNICAAVTYLGTLTESELLPLAKLFTLRAPFARVLKFWHLEKTGVVLETESLRNLSDTFIKISKGDIDTMRKRELTHVVSDYIANISSSGPDQNGIIYQAINN